MDSKAQPHFIQHHIPAQHLNDKAHVDGYPNLGRMLNALYP